MSGKTLNNNIFHSSAFQVKQKTENSLLYRKQKYIPSLCLQIKGEMEVEKDLCHLQAGKGEKEDSCQLCTLNKIIHPLLYEIPIIPFNTKKAACKL